MIVVLAAALLAGAATMALAWQGHRRFRDLQKWSKANSVAAQWSVHQPADPPVAATWCSLVDAKRAAMLRKRSTRRRPAGRAA